MLSSRLGTNVAQFGKHVTLPMRVSEPESLSQNFPACPMKTTPAGSA